MSSSQHQCSCFWAGGVIVTNQFSLCEKDPQTFSLITFLFHLRIAFPQHLQRDSSVELHTWNGLIAWYVDYIPKEAWEERERERERVSCLPSFLSGLLNSDSQRGVVNPLPVYRCTHPTLAGDVDSMIILKCNDKCGGDHLLCTECLCTPQIHMLKPASNAIWWQAFRRKLSLDEVIRVGPPWWD